MSGMGASTSSTGNASVVGDFHTALVLQGALILVILLLLVLGWNLLRSLQYRRAVARGERYPGPRMVMAAEPYARRVLRMGFGVLWLIDGLLQVQPGMPLGMPANVLQPAAAGSPGFVQRLVGFAVTTWSHHPSEAAASAVWIQLGIGMLLLVAPRGRWSRGAGVVAVGWGLVVWVFGEGFGGVFTPGLSLLFGAPGAALLYVVAGGLIALPDRAWATRQLGRVMTASLGVFLVVMAVLQAWPGRGFWQGTTGGGKPGTLASMIDQMAATPQPHALSSLLSSFGSFVEAHGWEVNLVVVVAVGAIGLALIVDRYVHAAVVALVVLGLAAWVLFQDMGIWGGTGTDPNSLLPLLLLAVGGYLAMTRVPAGDPVPVTEVAPASEVVPAGGPAVPDGEGPDVPAPRRPWWDRLDPGYAGRLAAALAAVAIVVVGAAPMVAASVSPRSDTSLAISVDGAPVDVNGPAPQFHLVDQHGTPVSLSDLRGYTVALTFLDPVCTSDCPIIAQEFRAASQLLGSTAQHVRFVAIDANPEYYSVAVIEAFDRQEGLSSQPNWLFLTGPRATLEQVWDHYGVAAVTAPAGGMVAHTDVAYVIDDHGSTRRVLNADPGAGTAQSESSFSALLAQQITQVINS